MKISWATYYDAYFYGEEAAYDRGAIFYDRAFSLYTHTAGAYCSPRRALRCITMSYVTVRGWDVLMMRGLLLTYDGYYYTLLRRADFKSMRQHTVSARCYYCTIRFAFSLPWYDFHRIIAAERQNSTRRWHSMLLRLPDDRPAMIGEQWFRMP